jgi:hypothetical protein
MRPCERYDIPKLTAEQRSNMNSSNRENAERAGVRARHLKNLISEENKKRVRELDEHQKVKSNHRPTAATTAIFNAHKQPQSSPQSSPHVHPAARKKTDSPLTDPMRRRAKQPTARMVWNNSPAHYKSFVELNKNEKEIFHPHPDLAASAFRDGLTIVANGGVYTTRSGQSEWDYSWKWSSMVSQIICETIKDSDKVTIKSNGGTGLQKLGSGTFNIVVSQQGGSGTKEMPEFVSGKDVVYRISRTDRCNKDNAYRYETIESASMEAQNAMFAAMNDVGVPLHAIASYIAPKAARSLRYGTVYVMDLAVCDLARQMLTMETFESGANMGVEVVELIYEASRCGIAFYDIKPGNILVIRDVQSPGGIKYRLTDYDASFFILTSLDWRALMLLNVGLLLAHVRNYPHTDTKARLGFVASVSPMVRQLIDRRDSYNSDWLFSVRPMRVPFEFPEVRGQFFMQKMLCIMTTSYVYGKNVHESIESLKHKWVEEDDQCELERWWRVPQNRDSWPPSLRKSYTPLIVKLVEFGLG